jgi:branched-chain amino acid transport system substrate-binding protein
VPRIQSGEVKALFIPDRATAPSIGALLQEAGVPQGKAQLVGSADWNNDSTIANTPYLAGALYPATDDAGFKTLSAEYQAMFGRPPHAFGTLAYTAVILANASSLALGNPKYAQASLTLAGGFNGRDGIFRFLPDGRSEYALVIKEVTAGGSRVVDTAKL